MRHSQQILCAVSGAASVLCLTAWQAVTLAVIVANQERRGRLPIHTFLDYVIFNYLIAIIFALTVRATLCCLATQRGGGPPTFILLEPAASAVRVGHRHCLTTHTPTSWAF